MSEAPEDESQLDRWTTVAVDPDAKPFVHPVPTERTVKIKISVSPETVAALAAAGARGDLTPAAVAGRIIEELRHQGTLAQNLKAGNNRHRRRRYHEKYS